jgi:hypothetical protein
MSIWAMLRKAGEQGADFVTVEEVEQFDPEFGALPQRDHSWNESDWEQALRVVADHLRSRYDYLSWINPGQVQERSHYQIAGECNVCGGLHLCVTMLFFEEPTQDPLLCVPWGELEPGTLGE